MEDGITEGVCTDADQPRLDQSPFNKFSASKESARPPAGTVSAILNLHLNACPSWLGGVFSPSKQVSCHLPPTAAPAACFLRTRQESQQKFWTCLLKTDVISKGAFAANPTSARQY